MRLPFNKTSGGERLRVTFFSKPWLSLVPATLLLAGASAATTAAVAATSGIFPHPPEGARMVTIRLAASERANVRQGYLMQRSPQALEEIASPPAAIAQAYAGKEFSAYEIARLPDGTRFLAVLNDDKTLKFLNRNESPVWYARIYKLPPGADAKPELLREGLQASGGDVTVPVEIELPGIGATKLKSFRAEVGYSLSGSQYGKPQIYGGRGAALTVSGSQIMQDGKLTMTVNIPDDLTVTPDTEATLRFEPLSPGLPDRSGSGKVSDFLTLGAARFVVTDLAPDFSSATVAVVAGSLEQTLKQQLQMGAEMPPFSQLELVTRKTVTRDDVLALTKKAGGVIFIFGDLPAPGPRSGPYMSSPAGSGGLPLPAAEIAEQLAPKPDSKPLLVFVTRQISIEFLYQDLRNKTPDYLVLTDFTDPLRTTFRVPQNPGYWGGSPYPMSHEPSLRQLFNLPDRIALAAFDSNGKVTYVKSDAAAQFLPSLAEARASLKGSKK